MVEYVDVTLILRLAVNKTLLMIYNSPVDEFISTSDPVY